MSGSVVFGALEHVLLYLFCYCIQIWSSDSSDFHNRVGKVIDGRGSC